MAGERSRLKITDGLLAAYDFSNGSLRDYFDAGPILVNASGATAVPGGKIGGAFAFGGYQGSGSKAELKTTDTRFSLRVPGGPASGRTRFFTFWAYADVWAPADRIFFATWQPTNPQFVCYVFNNTNVVTAIFDATNAQHFITTPRPSAGAWHFYTCYWDAASLRYGMSVDNGTPIVGTNSPSVKASTDYFSVGNYFGGVRPFSGLIDSFTVHDRMLTAAEVTFLYNAGVGQEPHYGMRPPNSEPYIGMIDPNFYQHTERSEPSLLDWLEAK